jgi:polysaccharide export outer membrane protein
MLKTGFMGLLFGFVLVGVAAGQSISPVNPDPAVSTAQTAPAQPAVAGGGAHPLRLSAGDLLDVKVLGTVDPDFSPKLRVDDSGAITLPYAGRVRVAGRTAEDAALLIEATFRDKDILKDPHVSVSVLEYATQGVTVVGEVKNPGVYPMLGTHSLLDLISAAGGVTPTAGKGVTITHRDDPNHPQIVNIETRPGSTAGFNVDVQPGDTIVVSHAGIIYVLGEVGKPGGFLIENSDRLTVLQAISLAQGTSRTASPDKSKLIRKTATGREELPIQVKKILADKAPDMMLADGDILYVPGSGPKNALRDVEAILPSAAGAAIYRVP